MSTFGSSGDGESSGGGGGEEGSSEKKVLTFGSAASTFGSAPNFSLGEGGKTMFGDVQKFGESSNAAEEEPEGESTAEFTPVVQLDEVDVRTHEEDEVAILKIRSKLFRYTETMLNKGSGKKEWIERGVGEMKLLKHRESERIRVLMRQEKTMKVIANHVVDPRIVLEPNVGNDRSWVWSCYDYSEGELVEEVFAIRFGTAENANKFKEAFIEAQNSMKALLQGEDGPPDEDADKAAEALQNLSAKEDEKPKEEQEKKEEQPSS